MEIDRKYIVVGVFIAAAGGLLAMLAYDYLRGGKKPIIANGDPPKAATEPAQVPGKFTMQGGTSTSVTPDETILTMVGTPCGANRTVVCIKVAGDRHNLRIGDEVNIPHSKGECQLTLVTIFEGENAAEFNLKC
ncbi:hypothetical protein [Microbulbifer litoralis]|uniref:hypothetical protein n=1 Tax=Microbulbifer litoralis TaxID=2933965 RepID=UPI00202991AC|nr:hypothetical protein [Microbulbifer sp. GX H0434]